MCIGWSQDILVLAAYIHTYEQRRLIQACANARSCQSIHYSFAQCRDIDEYPEQTLGLLSLALLDSLNMYIYKCNFKHM